MNAQVQTRIIAPADTDPAINTYQKRPYDHFVYYSPASVKQNLLFVFLPGTGARGGAGKDLNEFAAQMGYHVINLIYPDSIAMAQICKFGTDKYCYDLLRDELAFGTDRHPALTIDQPNSIIHRLTVLVKFLQQKYPDENWGQFIEQGQLKWNKIVLAGQSQGGGHAAYLAKKFEVARVLMFGSPKDYGTYTGMAEWLKTDFKTHANRFFGFSHTGDNVGCTFEQQVEIFTKMKMGQSDDLVDVSKTTFPFQHSRMLTTTKNVPADLVPHNSVYRDTSYSIVWKYMLTEPVQ